MQSIDFIGDIHGHADALRRLLERLGYRRHHGGYRHSDIGRTVVYVGDFIDRGPEPLETIEIVRAMRDSGDAEALMGNHEFNALGFGTLRADGKPYRSHGSGAMDQHAAFLKEAPIGSRSHDDVMRFFASLSIVYLGKRVRGVHAAWIDEAVATVRPYMTAHHSLRRTYLAEALSEGTAIHEALKPLLKGPEIKVSKEMAWIDAHGSRRTKNRVKWWNSAPQRLSDAIVIEGNQAVDEQLLATVPTFPQTDPRPVIFGHYCIPSAPTVLSPAATCVDFGVDKGGYLTAYTFNGESAFDPSKLTAIAA